MTEMRKLYLILLLGLLAGCHRLEEPLPEPVMAPEGEQVTVSFQVAVPGATPDTKALGMDPTIDPDGFYIAVFGGSGYFNQWVKATVDPASVHYDGTSATIYTLSATLAVSDSRLRLHFIANCPEGLRSSPPISGSQDTEEYVLSRIRSQLTDTYSDGYWQKVILPDGIRAVLDNDTYVATQATLKQFPSPIILVRNFARVYLRNLTPIVGVDALHNSHQLVNIRRYGLAYAPSEGVIAPILSDPYMSDKKGTPIFVEDTDEDTPLYYENFLMNYQRYPLYSNNPADTIITARPFLYGGYSPQDQAFDYYPEANHPDRGIPLLSDLKVWDEENPENNVLFIYERTRPSTTHRATRIIIEAERVDQNDNTDGVRYYALDIVNTDGAAIPLLRNQTYTVHLLDIEAGSGEKSIEKAAKAASASVSGDPDYQDLINISDGKSSIGTSFTEKFYVQPETDYVMFRYIPTNVGDESFVANVEGNDLVNVEVGTVNTETGIFSALTPQEALNRGVLAFQTDGNGYRVWIDRENGHVIPYVRQNNDWVVATQAQIQDMTVEKWGMIHYQLSESYTDEDGFFSQERTQAIRVVGRYHDREISRNVIIRTSPRQEIRVICQQKYVLAATDQQEVVRVLLPTELSRSVFPLRFVIEPNGYSLTPDGDDLPVDYGQSIEPGNSSPAFFFIKNLTQSQYDRLVTVRAEGKLWKSFDCRFKTTLADNACTVYVQNKFFDATYAQDRFYNYVTRQFSNLSFSPASPHRNGKVRFTFTMDAAHSGSPVVWWDPENALGQSSSVQEAEAKGLSAQNRVLPPVITVQLRGLELQYLEDGVTPVTSGLEHYSGNTYLYYTGTGTPTTDMANVELALMASGNVGEEASVTLSTANIVENPDLYESRSASGIIQGSEFTVYDTAPLPLGLNQTTSVSFSYVEGLVVPITLHLTNVEPVSYPGAFMSVNDDGTYTFTPQDTDRRSYEITLKSTTRYEPGKVLLENDYYDQHEIDLVRAATFNVPAGKLYARGYEETAPTKLGNRGVSVSSVKDGTALTSFAFNGSFYSNTVVSVPISSFARDDSATVYFRYTNSNNYYGTCTLGELFDLIEGNRDLVTLHLYRWATGTYSVSFNNNNYEQNTFNNEAVTVSFTNCEPRRDWILITYINARKNIGMGNNNGVITMTANPSLTGCRLSGATFTYHNNYNKQTTTATTGTIGNNNASWTASSSGEGNGDTNVAITMEYHSSDQVNAVTAFSVSYGYWDF